MPPIPKNIGDKVDETVKIVQRQLSSFERVHDVYYTGMSSKEGFWTRYAENHARYIQEFIITVDDTSMSKKLESVFKAHVDIAKDINEKYSKFKEKPVPTATTLKSAIDRVKSKINGSLIDNQLNEEEDRQRPYSLAFNYNRRTLMSPSEIRSAFEELDREFSKVYSNIPQKLRDDSGINNGDFIKNNIMSKVSVDELSRKRSTSEIKVQDELDALNKFYDVIAPFAQRVGMKTFDGFVNEFQLGSTSPLHEYFGEFKLSRSKSDLDRIASLDGLYEADVVESVSNLIQNAVKSIIDDLKPLEKNPDKVAQLKVDMKDLEASMNNIKPNEYTGPNYSTNRGARFVWTRAKMQLDAVSAKYGSDATSSDTDESLEGQGLLYRKPDVDRMAAYVALVNEFHKGIHPENGRLVKGINAMRDGIVKGLQEGIRNVNTKIEELQHEDDQAHVYYSTQRLVLQKVTMVQAFIREARHVTSLYVKLHTDFALKHNRQGMRYMTYWKAIRINSEGGNAQGLLDSYFATLYLDKTDSICTLGKMFVTERLESMFVSTFSTLQPEIVRNMDVEQVQDLAARFNELQEYVSSTAYHKVDIIHKGLPGIMDVLGDSQIMILYALKLIRFMSVIASLAIARRFFTQMYTDRVYDKNTEPPHPAVMIAIFLGVDAAFVAITAVVLSISRSLFSNGMGTFPIDDYLISRWALDYFASTVVISIIALIMSDVVGKRKYFRYRFEGERGIRALEAMVKYTAGVILLLPFYRMAD